MKRLAKQIVRAMRCSNCGGRGGFIGGYHGEWILCEGHYVPSTDDAVRLAKAYLKAVEK